MFDEALERIAGDVLGDLGFLPGLKPRGHEAMLGRGVAFDVREGDGLKVADEQRLDQLLYALIGRQQEGEIDGSDDDEAIGGSPPRESPPGDGETVDPTRGARRPSHARGDGGADGAVERAGQGSRLRLGVAGVDALPRAARGPRAALPAPSLTASPRTPEARRNHRRLAAARRDVQAFKARNRHQAELKTLLILILDHVRREHCEPDQAPHFERWWAVFRVYRRILGEPEMATRQARDVLARLLELELDELTERRLVFVLGRRKPRKAKPETHPVGIRIRR